WPVDDDQVLVGHIADQDRDDAEGKVKPCGDLGDGQDLVAEGGDGPLLHGQLRGLLPDRGGGNQRLDLQVVVGGPGAPAGHRIRPNSSRVRSWLIGGAGDGGPLPPRGSPRPPELFAAPVLADRRRWSWGASRGRLVTPPRPACCWLR